MNTTRGVAVGVVICLPGSGCEQVQHFFPWFSRVFLCVEPGTSQRCLALEVWQLAMLPIYLVAMLGVEYLGADVGIRWVILRFVNPAWDFSRWWMGSNCLNDSFWIVDWFILVHANVGELCWNCFVGNSVFEIFIYSSRLHQVYCDCVLICGVLFYSIAMWKMLPSSILPPPMDE